MTYRTPENLIRRIMSGQNLSEGHAPALKIPEPARVADALKVLKANGITSAVKQDENTITISNVEMNTAFEILDRAVINGHITAKPQVVSAEAFKVPEARPDPVEPTHEPHPPHGGQTFGEAVVGGPDPITRDEIPSHETEQNQGKIEDHVNVTLVSRSLVNRMENKLKKIDENTEFDSELDEMIQEATAEDIKQLDELSKNLLTSYIQKASASAVKQYQDGTYRSKEAVAKTNKRVNSISKATDRLAKEEVEQIDELSYGKLKAYTKAGAEQLANKKGDAMDAKLARRERGLMAARKQKVAKISKVAFGESVSPVSTVLRVLSEAAKLRLIATHHSENGKHTAKVYKDHEWGEHRVKYFINGKHHEPADSHHGDADDAHDTARHELKRLNTLHGALKEATEEDINSLMEDFEQLDELSKSLLGRYISRSSNRLVDKSHDLGRSLENPSINVKNNSRQIKNTQKGVERAVHKIVNNAMGGIKVHATEAAEEGETPFQLNELSKQTLTSYTRKSAIDMSRNYEKSPHKSYKRFKGILKATGKLMKEEPEQIDEISQTSLQSYVHKASRSADSHNNMGDGAFSVGNKKKADSHYRKADNRSKGIDKAFDKLHRTRVEEVEQIDESKKSDVLETAKKHLFKHPEANAIGNSIQVASRHYNYVQDACDHVYNNHIKDMSYEDFDRIKPHLENEFKAHGLK